MSEQKQELRHGRQNSRYSHGVNPIELQLVLGLNPLGQKNLIQAFFFVCVCVVGGGVAFFFSDLSL